MRFTSCLTAAGNTRLPGHGSRGFKIIIAQSSSGPKRSKQSSRSSVKPLAGPGATPRRAVSLASLSLSIAVWKAMDKLKDAKLTARLGVAPGPANGFTLDLLLCFERFGPLLDWAMIILNPLEPWPGSLVLPAAVKHDVNLITRVVDYGGLFHNDVKPGHQFSQQDHRAFRPTGWVEAGCEKMDQMRDIAAKHKVTVVQLACLWDPC